MKKSVVTFCGVGYIITGARRQKMTFGEKLKQLRKDNNLTQEDLAEKIFVTRTAVSKWETDKALPAIDSLKLLSALFRVGIDDLISDGDIETKRLLDEKRAKLMYGIAVGFLVLATVFTLLAYFLKQPYFSIGGVGAVALYLLFGLLSKPRYKRLSAKKMLLPYIISRAVILLFVVGLIVFTIVTL